MAEAARTIAGLLSRLAQGGHLRRSDEAYVLVGLRGPRRSVAPAMVERLLARGLLRSEAGAVVISRLGEEWLAQGSHYAEQHQLLETRAITGEDGITRFAVVNAAESPLTLLARLKWLAPNEVEAGEKLRRDFTIGGLTQKTGIDYTMPIGARSHRPDMAETALAARQRFNRALKAIGPGLADLVFDLCCYLKGLEESEKARGWPRGSAKVVLRLALSRLAGHYGFGAPQTVPPRAWSAPHKESEEKEEKDGAEAP